MSLKNVSGDARLPIGKSLQHLVVFQFKLLADAARDFVFSPLSIVAFIIDAVFRPRLSKSLTLRLMMMGRHSDRIINLFNAYNETDIYTPDDDISEIEKIKQHK